MTSNKTMQEVAREYLAKIRRVRSFKKLCEIVDEWHFLTRRKQLRKDEREDLITHAEMMKRYGDSNSAS